MILGDIAIVKIHKDKKLSLAELIIENESLKVALTDEEMENRKLRDQLKRK